MNKILIENIFSFIFAIVFNKNQHNTQSMTLLNIKDKTDDKKAKRKISVLKHLSKKFS